MLSGTIDQVSCTLAFASILEKLYPQSGSPELLSTLATQALMIHWFYELCLPQELFVWGTPALTNFAFASILEKTYSQSGSSSSSYTGKRPHETLVHELCLPQELFVWGTLSPYEFEFHSCSATHVGLTNWTLLLMGLFAAQGPYLRTCVTTTV